MNVLRAVGALTLALVVQAGLGKLWPDVHRYVDLMFLPVIWYGLRHSQAQAMWIGCAAGLMQDTWFQAGVFGLNGFKKTLLGWTLGGLGGRFDLNGQTGRVVAGVLLVLADGLLDQGLRRLLDQQPGLPGIFDLLTRALVTGILVRWSFGLFDRGGTRQPARRWA